MGWTWTYNRLQKGTLSVIKSLKNLAEEKNKTKITKKKWEETGKTGRKGKNNRGTRRNGKKQEETGRNRKKQEQTERYKKKFGRN